MSASASLETLFASLAARIISLDASLPRRLTRELQAMSTVLNASGSVYLHPTTVHTLRPARPAAQNFPQVRVPFWLVLPLLILLSDTGRMLERQRVT